MQADEQPTRSPPHSLSLDHDMPPRPPSLAPVGRHNSFNIHIQTSSNSQERMLLSLPSDYSSNTDGRQTSYKNQTRKVIKRQAANVDDSSLSSLPYSYQESKVSNNSIQSASKENFAYNTHNRYALPVLESKGKEYSKTDASQYWDETNRFQNDGNCPNFSVEVNTNKKKNHNKSESLSKATGKKYDKNYSRLDTVATIRSEKLANTYLYDIDLFETEFSHIPNKETPEKPVKVEKKANKVNVSDTFGTKIYESMSGCSSTLDNVIPCKSDYSKVEKVVNTYLCDIDILETEFPHLTNKGNLDKPIKVEKKHNKPDKTDSSAPKIYESMSRCSNEVDNVNSFNDNPIKNTNPSYKIPGNQYVDMGVPFKETKQIIVTNSKYQDKNDGKNCSHSRALQDNSNRMHSGRRKSDKITRRHTTEYRGPPHLVLPPLTHDSSDSAERSPITKKDPANNYPYSMLTDQKYLPKKNSITSSTSEENSDIMAAAIKIRMQAKEWRENKTPKRVDSLTVDRRSTRKNASKSAKIKRRGSLNIIDPSTGMQLPLHVAKEKDMSCSMRSCNIAKSPLMDARKTPLQISAEDMVQIANCGARNKNGSLCHFISTNNENYLSISQALLDHSSSSEAKLAENKTLPRKFHTTDRNPERKSTHSLAMESSDDTLCRDEVMHDYKEKIFAKYFDTEQIRGRSKIESIDRRHKGHTRQRSHDLDKSLKVNKMKQEVVTPRKLVQTKSEGQRTYKQPTGYYLLENESGVTMNMRMPDNLIQRKENIKFQSPSTETLDKPARNSHHLDGSECRCLGVSNHSLAKVECPVREKNDMSSDTDPSNHVFRRFGTSSREELTNSEDVEETFDF